MSDDGGDEALERRLSTSGAAAATNGALCQSDAPELQYELVFDPIAAASQ